MPVMFSCRYSYWNHGCHVTSHTAGGSGRLITASTLQPTHFPSAVAGEQPISCLILVFLYPALCYFHQLPTKYLNRHVHLNGVHLSYLEPLSSRQPLPHINWTESITFTAWSSEWVMPDFLMMWGCEMLRSLTWPVIIVLQQNYEYLNIN